MSCCPYAAWPRKRRRSDSLTTCRSTAAERQRTLLKDGKPPRLETSTEYLLLWQLTKLQCYYVSAAAALTKLGYSLRVGRFLPQVVLPVNPIRRVSLKLRFLSLSEGFFLTLTRDVLPASKASCPGLNLLPRFREYSISKTQRLRKRRTT